MGSSPVAGALVVAGFLLPLADGVAAQQSGSADAIAPLAIPRVSAPPRLEDFLSMAPSPDWTGRLASIDRFIQRAPKDGDPATERTDVFVGYDAARFYVIFVA